MDVFCPRWLTSTYTLQQRQGSCLKGNRGVQLLLEAPYRPYQEAFWTCNKEITHILEEMDMDQLVRDIQQAFTSGNRESARLLTKQLQPEHIATLHALLPEFTVNARMQYAAIASRNIFIQPGSVNVAASPESRVWWPVRTASYRRLRDHSLVSSCRQKQLYKIFAFTSLH